MTISTRLTELLRVEHPIMLAPMDIVADGKLAATVTAAGGFGIIGGGYGNEAWVAGGLRAGRQRGDRCRFHHMEHGPQSAPARYRAGAQARRHHAVVRRRKAACRQD